MTAGVRHLHEAGSWTPRENIRRGIEPSDIAYAKARRPRQGWQTIAHQLGVNAADLQRMVEGTEAVQAPVVAVAKPKPKPPALASASPSRSARRSKLKPDGGAARTLLAIADGAMSYAAIAAAARISADAVKAYALHLRQLGLIDYKADAGWPITPAGWAEVAALNAIEAEAERG